MSFGYEIDEAAMAGFVSAARELTQTVRTATGQDGSLSAFSDLAAGLDDPTVSSVLTGLLGDRDRVLSSACQAVDGAIGAVNSARTTILVADDAMCTPFAGPTFDPSRFGHR